MTECVTWNCTRPGIAHLVIRRPCGHAVALNSSGLGPRAIDGSPPARVQRQWSCADCIRARAGRSAPGPSTCPECGVREPVRVDMMMHSQPVLAAGRCRTVRDGGFPEVAAYNGDRARQVVNCPDCLEWLHS